LFPGEGRGTGGGTGMERPSLCYQTPTTGAPTLPADLDGYQPGQPKVWLLMQGRR